MAKHYKTADTRAVHAGVKLCPTTGAVVTPIYQTSTFAFKNAQQGADRFSGKEKGYIYTRLANPTIDALEQNLAAMEGGVHALATASGMAASNTVFLALLKSGDHVVCTDSVYGPTRMVLEKAFVNFGITSSFVNTADLGAVSAAIKSNTKLVFIETPANPTLKLSDISAISELAHQAGALVAVDNTFMSPVLQRPLELGADIVIHSLTKFINGHCDVVGGAVICNEPQYNKLRWTLSNFGGTMDPFAAWLVLRGAKTLPLRMKKHCENGQKVAEFLSTHPKVAKVFFPGLPDHPQHQLAKRQMDDFGGMVAFEVKGGVEGGKTVMDNVKLCTLAVSLGGVESLIQHPAFMTHSGMAREDRLAAGITDGLVRLSCGIEDAGDIIEDLVQALEKIQL